MMIDMKRFLSTRLSGTLLLLLLAVCGLAQTTISTITTAPTLTANPGVVTFAVRNTNSYPIAITDISAFHHTNNNGKTYTIWYHPTALTGAPSITVANNWQQFGVSPVISATTSGVRPIVTNKYLVIPANTTYRFAVTVSAAVMYYGSSTTNTWSSGGVDILTGNNATSPGYAGSFPSPTTTPATFVGSVTYVTAAVDNLTALSVVQPVNGAQFCSYTPTLIRAVVRNVGANPQSNFPVTAAYSTTTSTTTITGTYTGTLAPFTSDTVVIGTILPPPGAYTVKAYTQLPSDTVELNDTTTSSVNFTYKDPVGVPVVFSDTVCSGGNAFVGVQVPQPNTTYRWYSAQTGGTLVNISNNLTFANLTQDTIVYIAAFSGNCESDRSMVSAIVGPPPSLNLPDDTSFCESIPLILDAGNPGGTYLWSTGDTTQTITVTNVSGTYWVSVNKYCTSMDTVTVTIAPLPTVSGISYIKMGNTYYFNPSSVQNVTGYYWVFGDGTTSNDSAAVHTFLPGLSTQYTVMLVVYNDCGTDTVYRGVTVAVDDIAGSDAAVTLQPNPANDYVVVTSDKAVMNELYLMNSIGSIVRKEKALSGRTFRLDTEGLPSGHYMLSIRTSSGNLNKPLIIVR